jgi:hypothetical protein
MQNMVRDMNKKALGMALYPEGYNASFIRLTASSIATQ